MLSESSGKRGGKANQVAGAPPLEPEQLQCPRCDSKNTKFCYYNNYNFSQPRHFCKSCRRYWTKGGTLRDIPVGGGSRKNAKRSRTLLPYFSSSATSAPDFIRRISSHPLAALTVDHVGPQMSSGVSVCGSFTSLLNTQGPGLFALGGFGDGIEGIGHGIGRAVWPFPGVGIGDAGGSGGAGSVLGNHWYVQGGEGGGIGNEDCFTLADVAAP